VILEMIPHDEQEITALRLATELDVEH